METLGTKNVQPNPVNPLVCRSACCADGWSCFPQNKPHANPAASDQHDTALKHRLVPHLTRLFLASLFRAAHSHSNDGRLPPSMSRPEQAASGLETPHPLTETSSLVQRQHKRSPVLPALWSGKNRDKSRLFTRNDKAFSYLQGKLSASTLRACWCYSSASVSQYSLYSAPQLQAELQPDARLSSVNSCHRSCQSAHISDCVMNTRRHILYCSNRICARSAVRNIYAPWWQTCVARPCFGLFF